MNECDLLIAGGTVIDGTGAVPVAADVAIGDGRILAVGTLTGWQAETTLNAKNRTVCPGFIDTHSHDEIAAVDAPEMTAKLSQGVTTVIAGNCGISAAPLDRTAPLPPPFPLLGDDDAFRFSTVRAYRDALATARPAVNLALLAGHTSLRVAHVAELEGPARPSEVAAMTTTLAKALDDGCIGMSSGVDYPPAAAAGPEELAAVLEAATPHPHAVYSAHIRDEGTHIIDAIDEAVTTASLAQVRLVISHHKCAGPPNYGCSSETLSRIDAARNHRLVHLDVYPYTASSTSLLTKFAEGAESTVVAWSTPHPELSGRTLEDIAKEWNCETGEAIERLSPAGAIYFQMDEADVQRILAHPAAMVGSDGLPGRTRPHPRLWGTFPRVLGRYVRDLGTLTLVDAIHKMTGLPASVFPVGQRGEIVKGAIADLVVFDPNTISDTATYDDPEVPATGIDAVIVGGAVSWTDTGATGVRNGQFLASSDYL